MKLKVELSQREDNHQKKYHATLIDYNIIVDDRNQLPNYVGNFINFVADFSPAYDEFSKGLVNTRFRYPENNGKSGEYYVYAKLSWLQRRKLAFISRLSGFHKYPVVLWTLVINSFFALANLGFAYMNYQNNLKGVQSSYLDTITKQIELQRLQSEQHQKLMEIALKSHW